MDKKMKRGKTKETKENMERIEKENENEKKWINRQEKKKEGPMGTPREL